MDDRITIEVLDETGGKTYPIGPRGQAFTFVVGRGDDVDLLLNDRSVSRRHCEFAGGPAGVTLRDLGSRTGTYCNAERMADERVLRDGDEVQVGTVVLRVHIHAPLAEDDSDATLPFVPPRTAGSAAGGSARGGFQPARHEGTPPAPPAAAPNIGPPAPVLNAVPVAERTMKADDGRWGDGPAHELIVPLKRDGVVLGRDAECDVTLDIPTVSRRHAEVRGERGVYSLRDLGSANGTFVNGVRISDAYRLALGDVVRIGPYDLVFNGAALSSRQVEQCTRIEVRGLGKEVVSRETGRPEWLLRDIELVIEPREFVGVFGSSGCGKSTLMDTLNGRRPATAGLVLYNGDNFYNQFDAYKNGIGYVPQELIFHQQLPVADALRYACQLRLPPDVRDDEIERQIDRVLEVVQLSERRNTVIAQLSGGQKKRVSLAIELLTRPTVLFLDEVTSGLDVRTEFQMMELFRKLADGGVTTVCISHYVDSLDLCDMVVYLIKGRLAFFGPPREMKRYFGVSALREVFLKEGEKTPEEWEAAYRQSPAYTNYVVGRQRTGQPAGETVAQPGEAIADAPAVDVVKQFRILTRRNVQVMLADWRNLLISLLLAPLIGVMMSMVLRAPDSSKGAPPHASAPTTGVVGSEQRAAGPERFEPQQRQTNIGFIAMVAVFFLGIFGSVREVVKERAIYGHERFINLQIVPYLASKLLPLAAVAAVQAFTLAATVMGLTTVELMPGRGFLIYAFVLFVTGLVALLLGLVISCGVENEDKAVILMVLAIIPQILFANVLSQLKGLAALMGQLLVPAYWSVQALQALTLEGLRKLEDPWLVRSLLILAWFAVSYALSAAYLLRRKDGPYGKPFAIPWVKSGNWVVFRTRVRRGVAVPLDLLVRAIRALRAERQA